MKFFVKLGFLVLGGLVSIVGLQQTVPEPGLWGDMEYLQPGLPLMVMTFIVPVLYFGMLVSVLWTAFGRDVPDRPGKLRKLAKYHGLLVAIALFGLLFGVISGFNVDALIGRGVHLAVYLILWFWLFKGEMTRDAEAQ